jgi:hypothetical protein
MPRVQALCKKHNVVYSSRGMFDAIQFCLSDFKAMAGCLLDGKLD